MAGAQTYVDDAVVRPLTTGKVGDGYDELFDTDGDRGRDRTPTRGR